MAGIIDPISIPAQSVARARQVDDRAPPSPPGQERHFGAAPSYVRSKAWQSAAARPWTLSLRHRAHGRHKLMPDAYAAAAGRVGRRCLGAAASLRRRGDG